jgi:uncharacterized repeat protein (TIGR02543 family)
MAVGGAAWPESPKRNGFAFCGWYTGKNGSGSVFTAETVVLGAVYVYAKWTKSSAEQDSTVAPPDVTLNGENPDLAALIPGPGGSGTQTLDMSDENLESILRPGFALEVTVPVMPASAPNRIPAPIMQSLFGTVLSGAKAPELVQGSLGVPSGRLHVTYVGLSVGGVPVLEVDPETPVLISIPYTLSGEATGHPGNLRALHVSENGEASEMMGGRYNPETGTMDFAASLLGCFLVVYVP